MNPAPAHAVEEQPQAASAQFAETIATVAKRPLPGNDNFYASRTGLASLLAGVLDDQRRFMQRVDYLLTAIHAAHRQDDDMAAALVEIGSGWMVQVQGTFGSFATVARQAIQDAEGDEVVAP